MTDPVDLAYDEGRAAFPAVGLSRERFRELASSRFDGPSAHGADLFLAAACAAGDGAALAAFERRYLAEVSAFLARVTRDAAEIDEVRQRVRERLFVSSPPKIGEYAGRGPLAGWLRVVTLRAHANMRRGERAMDDLDDAPAVAVTLVDPELAIVRGRHREDFDQALRSAFDALTPRQRTLLRMTYVDGMTADAVATVFRAHRVTVARWLSAARAELFEGARARLRERLGVADEELESLLGDLRSAVDLSLSSLLASRR